MSVPSEAGSESYSLGTRVGPNEISIPNMFNMSGFRDPDLQQVPCKTINEVTYPPFRVSNVPVDSGYYSYTFGRGMNVSKDDRMYHDPYFKLNNPILQPAPTFLF